ncbi:MAG: hypothetical protein MJ233_00695 [Mycoplasmoidaceae bacterium]|nr:hypothetical protein [Mycoplasmoidaceae bacterium]
MGLFNSAAAMAITKELEIETKATLEEIKAALESARIKAKVKNSVLNGKSKGLFSKTQVTATVHDDGDTRMGSVIIVGPAKHVSSQMAELKLHLKKYIK